MFTGHVRLHLLCNIKGSEYNQKGVTVQVQYVRDDNHRGVYWPR